MSVRLGQPACLHGRAGQRHVRAEHGQPLAPRARSQRCLIYVGPLVIIVTGKAGTFVKNLYGALDQGEEGDIVARSIVCCKGGTPVAMPPPPQPTPIKPKPVSAQDVFNGSCVPWSSQYSVLHRSIGASRALCNFVPNLEDGIGVVARSRPRRLRTP